MRKKIKTPKSCTGVLPEICDFEKGGAGGETLPLNPFLMFFDTNFVHA